MEQSVLRFVFRSVLAGAAAALALTAFVSRAVIPVNDVAKDPREVPPSPVGDVTVDLDVVEVLGELASGVPAWLWTFATATCAGFS